MAKVTVTKATVEQVANQLTCNSELFGDEVGAVVRQLMELVNSAEQFGCEMTGKVSNYWGNTYTVTAVPSVRRDTWSF